MAFLAWVTLSTLLGTAQAVVPSPEEFTRAGLMEKRQILGRLSREATTLPSDRLRDLVSTALGDSSPEIRSAALWQIVGVVMNLQVRDDPQRQLDEWRQRREIVSPFRDHVPKYLEDPDAGVRSAAVRAVTVFEQDLTVVPGSAQILSADITRLITKRFAAEPSELVRADLTNVFAWFRPDPSLTSDVQRLLGVALSDRAPAVLQAAGWAAAKQQDAALLPMLARALSHERYEVRMVIAQAIASYRAAARPYLPDLQRALEKETHDITRKTLEGTISVITR